MKLLRGLAVVAVLCAFPAVALAYKPASKSQSAALYRAVAGKDPAGIPQRCLRFEVSTANSAWATVDYNDGPKGAPRGCLKYGFNGVTIFHYRAGRWRYVDEGSAFVEPSGRCSLTGKIPQSVIKDFKLC
jgi:hypothetical protein